jgi:hypothetical protein
MFISACSQLSEDPTPDCELSIRLTLIQQLFDVHLDPAIWTFGNIFFRDVNYLRSLTFGAFNLDGISFVSHECHSYSRTYYHKAEGRTRKKRIGELRD